MLGLAFRAREFCGIFVGFLDEFFDAGAGGVVVEEFVVAFFDAVVDVGEVGAEAGDGFEDGFSGVKVGILRGGCRWGWVLGGGDLCT